MSAAVAAAVASARRRVITHFMSANAVTPDRAIAFASSRHVERRVFARLQREGVILPAANGYYIDIPAYDAWHTNLRHRILLVAGAALVIGAIAIAMLR